MTSVLKGNPHSQTLPLRQPLPTHSGKNILLVDSDQRILETLSASLTRQGYCVSTARDGAAGLRKATCQPTNLVIIDAHLPDADGMQVCAQLTEDSATCGIPVIILSDLGDPCIVRQARAAGCSFFLRKPFDPNVLLTLIEKSLHVRHEMWMS